MRRFVLACAVAMLAVSVPGVALAAAGGNTINPGNDAGYFQPPSAATVCDAGHGAFGAFSHNSGGWIPADAKEDGGLGHDTGPTNSGFSQYCRTQ